MMLKRVGFISALATLAIACQSSPPSGSASAPSVEATPTASVSPEEVASPEATPTEQPSYVNQQIGFTFTYPDDFVVDSSEDDPSAPTEDDLQLALDLWEREQYQDIEAGQYEGGTELPPNVQVAIYQNGDRLPLEDWIAQNNRFVVPGEFQTQAIAGQEALTFPSEGLYGYDNVVLSSPTGGEVIVISLGKMNVPELDGANQQAFEQVVSTFQFTN
ncbi:hypothetical protein H6G89_00820 [Oscillatoria sp. FACHB-1407]|uniref:hypothetical protein n=1 Tax=Oscillatoria sp. FACHB-1407 TaxID=2692847 RepID=UPI001688F2CB|nr:hypothetical protein [Oscillatoria sp. FACHB-1407]MBD2459572.1 hypothetical protein [Oscillatoria sp. FACHB-1407]